MSNFPVELLPFIKYATPPAVGAFIGYLTNRVAIRMLFRPLKAWKIAGLRVPMTPGVIPSKRDELAQNMGEVVGDHLLTSKEIGHGLEQEVFQHHLYSLIKGRVEAVMHKDLGPLGSVIPKKFLVYFDIGTKTITYQLKNQVRKFVQSDDFGSIIDNATEQRIESFLRQEIETVLSKDKREEGYAFIEENIARMFASSAMEQWVEAFVHEKVYSTLQHEKSVADILPGSLLELFMSTIEKQVPAFLRRVAVIVSEPDVRDSIVRGACAGVESFIESLGSMADMVRNFLKMETVEEKIREYLIEKEDDIVAWLQSADVQEKVVAILRERSRNFLEKPIVSMVKAEDESVIKSFCEQCTKQIILALRGEDIATTLTSMIRSNLENHLDSGAAEIGNVLRGLLGTDSLQNTKNAARSEVKKLLQGEKTLNTLDSIVDSLIISLLEKPIGKLANIVPLGVREGFSQSLLRMVSAMLATEVPGLVQSLNIRQIVTKRINSLDLLRLEGLLLSIMEEQFKYINLFGALLGFLIGCINLVFLYGI